MSIALVALVTLGWFGWSWADSALTNRAQAEAASCPEGNSSIRVVVAPQAEQPLSGAATKWNQSNTVIHGRCIQVEVQPAESQHVYDALTTEAATDQIGGLPAAWVPETSQWADKLSAAKPETIGSSAESISSAHSGEDYPYLSLAGDGVDGVQQRAAQSFREFLKEPAQQQALRDTFNG